MEIAIRSTAPGEPGARRLIDALDRYQLSLYPAESNHLEPPEALGGDDVVFLCAYRGEQIVACGAAKLIDAHPDYGELKRMYVDPACRGQGLSRRMLQALEAALIERAYTLARLETGIHQPEAIGLYESLGYRRRGPFGSYCDDPLSVFMEKHLR